ncbi:MAG: LacI family DNA-binding transcriptional regulator [Sediminibacterium sp.]|nr:LacI family DNA-binding transcriptional regulator [Sediminibacterium sp.]MBX9779042.1 LacI family transcriptional regulator [Chitinophagaceae bacterium]
MKFEAVTIKDIAKALGLSTSTVSRALRDSYEISPETKEKVLQYARETNYRPNPIALSLKEKRSSSIGVLVSEIANSFFSQVINGIESVAQERGYNVVIAQSKESYEREVSALNYLASRSVDGIILSVSAETYDFSAISNLYNKGMAMVGFDRIAETLQMHKVIVNNKRGAYDATSQLIKNGFKNIACIASSSYLSISKERIQGYIDALQENNIKVNDELIAYCAHGGMLYDEVEVAMKKLMSSTKKPDAIIACSDKITTNAMRYCKKEKIAIPEKLGLIGFSNLDLTELLSPSLSVVRQPAGDMGKKAAELLLSMIESKRAVTEFQTVVLPAEIHERESSIK